jgi:hypothetical protein
VATKLKDRDVDFLYINELCGWSQKGTGEKSYAKRYQVEQLYEKAVLKLDFGIDLSHLKGSKFVP